MKLTVTKKDGSEDVYAESNEPFMDILGFSYNGETGFFVVSFAGEGLHRDAKNVANGVFERTYGTGQWRRVNVE